MKSPNGSPPTISFTRAKQTDGHAVTRAPEHRGEDFGEAVSLRPYSERVLETYEERDTFDDDHPAGDSVKSGLSDERRIGELESLVAELQAEVEALREQSD